MGKASGQWTKKILCEENIANNRIVLAFCKNACVTTPLSQLYTYFLSTLKCEPSNTIKASATFGAENEHLILTWNNYFLWKEIISTARLFS